MLIAFAESVRSVRHGCMPADMVPGGEYYVQSSAMDVEIFSLIFFGWSNSSFV